METTKKSLLIFLAVVVVGVGVYGGFYLTKKFSNKQSPVVSQVATTTTVDTSGITRDLKNGVPASFPKNLIIEKNVSPIESFSVKKDSVTQNTYRYRTTVSYVDNYKHFIEFVRANGWQIQSIVHLDTGWIITASKPEEVLSVSYSVNSLIKDIIIDITLSQQK